jgi:hypothetical protein
MDTIHHTYAHRERGTFIQTETYTHTPPPLHAHFTPTPRTARLLIEQCPEGWQHGKHRQHSPERLDHLDLFGGVVINRPVNPVRCAGGENGGGWGNVTFAATLVVADCRSQYMPAAKQDATGWKRLLVLRSCETDREREREKQTITHSPPSALNRRQTWPRTRANTVDQRRVQTTRAAEAV